jgi:hypothetical protein
MSRNQSFNGWHSGSDTLSPLIDYNVPAGMRSLDTHMYFNALQLEGRFLTIDDGTVKERRDDPLGIRRYI